MKNFSLVLVYGVKEEWYKNLSTLNMIPLFMVENVTQI